MKYIYLLFFIIFTNLFAINEDSLNVQKIKLQLQWQHQFEFAGFYAAKEKGFYKDLGLDVDFIEFNPKNHRLDESLYTVISKVFPDIKRPELNYEFTLGEKLKKLF